MFKKKIIYIHLFSSNLKKLVWVIYKLCRFYNKNQLNVQLMNKKEANEIKTNTYILFEQSH